MARMNSNLIKTVLLALVCCAVGAPTLTNTRNDTAFNAIGKAIAGQAAGIASFGTRAQHILYPRPPTGAAPHTNGTRSQGTGTAPGTAPATAPPTELPTTFAPSPLQLSLVNNLNSNKAHAYVSALDVNGQVVMLRRDGSFYHPPDPKSQTPRPIAADVAIPLPATGQSLNIAIPDYVEGARIWFADGKLEFSVVSTPNGPALVEPTAMNPEDASAKVNWGFVELTHIAGYGLFANLSFVDFLGLALAMRLQTTSSGTQLVKGIRPSAARKVCNKLKRHSGVDRESWAGLCVSNANGKVLRVISPSALISRQPSAFGTVFGRYVDRVWDRYASSSLTIDTQSAAGSVSCRTRGGRLMCDGDNRGYAKPTASDIFGCNTGPFAIEQTDNQVHKAIVPRLCAAFHRGTFLVDGGNIQPSLPPSRYYEAKPSNWYSAFVHEVELDGRGYAFAYDDVAPNTQDEVAGTVAAADPRLLTVFVGGM